MNLEFDIEKINKLQKIITLFDTTIKMLNSAIGLKNSIKKEIYHDKEDDKKNLENENQNTNNSFSHLINKNSFKNYKNNFKCQQQKK